MFCAAYRIAGIRALGAADARDARARPPGASGASGLGVAKLARRAHATIRRGPISFPRNIVEQAKNSERAGARGGRIAFEEPFES